MLTLVLLAVWFAASAIASPDEKVKAHGTLTSVEDDGTVLIDDKGYEVDPAARIINGRGKRSTLDKLVLPFKVEFEFIYTQRGPVIKLIREIPQ